MSDLRTKLIRLAHQNPALRADLLPLLKSGSWGDDPDNGQDHTRAEQRERSEDLESQIEELEGQLKGYGDIGEPLKKATEALATALDYKAKIEAKAKAYQKEVDKARQALADAEEELQNYQSDVEIALEELAEARSAVKDAQEEKRGNQVEIDELDSNLESLRDELSGVEDWL